MGSILVKSACIPPGTGPLLLLMALNISKLDYFVASCLLGGALYIPIMSRRSADLEGSCFLVAGVLTGTSAANKPRISSWGFFSICFGFGAPKVGEFYWKTSVLIGAGLGYLVFILNC